MSLPEDPKQPYADLPPHPTIGEIVAQIGDVARENLAKITPPQGQPAPEQTE